MTSTIESTRPSPDRRRPAADAAVGRVLVVGTFGGGGIHHFIDEQRRHLRGRVAVSTYDMYMPPEGEGLLWFAAAFVRSLWAALRFPFRSPPDVVHVHTSHDYSFYRAAFYVLVARYGWRRPVVLHVHGSAFDDFLDEPSPAVRWLQTHVFEASDAVVVLSAYWRNLLSQRVDPDRIRVVPNAVDPDLYEPRYDAEVPHLAFVSTIYGRKGIPELMAAVEALDEAGVGPYRLSVAGSGPLSDEVAAFAARHDHVEYLGWIEEDEKRRLLESATVFVLPTRAEGLPIAMLEGMAGGNAVVSTGVGAIPEVIGPDNGLLVEPGDVDDLVAALERLISDPALVERLGRRNRRAVEEEYSWRATSDDLLSVYAAVVEANARGPAAGPEAPT